MTKQIAPTTIVQPVAVVATYEGLIRTLAGVRRAQGLSQLALDERAGLPSGYTGKLEGQPGKPNSKTLGRLSFDLLFQALSVKLVLEQSDAPLKAKAIEEQDVARELRRRYFRDLASRGGRAAQAKLTRQERSRRARKQRRRQRRMKSSAGAVQPEPTPPNA
jgi:hypothetical protein